LPDNWMLLGTAYGPEQLPRGLFGIADPAYPLSSADLPWQILRKLTDGEA
jgi:hypothetical protein